MLRWPSLVLISPVISERMSGTGFARHCECTYMRKMKIILSALKLVAMFENVSEIHV